MKLKQKLVVVTPHQAKYWLDNCNLRNRNLRSIVVSQFAQDMINNRWKLHHQGIAFYEDGTLADGQHRLAAIVRANKPIELYVTTGLQHESAAVIDQGVTRKMHDAIRILGGNDWIDKHIVAMCRFLIGDMGKNTDPVSTNTVIDYANRYQYTLELVKSMTGTKKRYVTHAGLAACYACAIQAGIPEAKIKRFAEIMLKGEINGPKENAAIRLREYLISNPGCWIGRERLETCMRAQRAIDAFSKDQSLAKLYLPSSLTYPTPE